MGPTCGLLPVGIDETILSTRGLEWDLSEYHKIHYAYKNLSDSAYLANTPSSFEGLVSTSNHIIGSEVWIRTTKPIWWGVTLKEH